MLATVIDCRNALLFHLFDPQQAKTMTFSRFSANIPGADCRYILEETAAYTSRPSEKLTRMSNHWHTGLQTKNVSHISLTSLYFTCLFILIPSMLSTV